MIKRKGFEFKTYISNEYGYVVGITEFRGRIIVACQKAVLELVNDKLVPIKFEVKDES
jgi:hypothetical protein